jgi:hypothetical protein
MAEIDVNINADMMVEANVQHDEVDSELSVEIEVEADMN